LPSILLVLTLSSVTRANEPTKLDLTGLLPFNASSLKQLNPPPHLLTAEIILVGGKEAMQLGEAFKALSKDPLTKIRVDSFTSPEFNLARIYSLFLYHKIRPQWVIYVPSRDDEKEEIFPIQNASSIQFNLQRGQSWWWQLLYKIWPGLALATLKKVEITHLPLEPSFPLRPISDPDKIQHSITHASLFKLLLEQWILKNPQTKFLLVSTPRDPNITPDNCKTSLKWPTRNFLKDQFHSIQKENWEEALAVNDDLMKVAPYYATSYYSRAKILHKLNDFENSNRFLQLSWMLDCRLPYTALKNSLMQNQTIHFPQQVYFYNLTQLIVDECFQKDKKCFEGHELVPTYYQSAAKVLKFIIEEKL